MLKEKKIVNIYLKNVQTHLLSSVGVIFFKFFRASSKSDNILGWNMTMCTAFTAFGLSMVKLETASIMACATCAAPKFPAPKEMDEAYIGNVQHKQH